MGPFIHALGDKEQADLQARSDRVLAVIEEGGLAPGGAAMRLQLNFDDVYDRRSAACPYERLRARLIVVEQFSSLPMPASEIGPWFIAVGDPKLRLRSRELDQFSPHKVLRRWRTACEKLHAQDLDIVSFCVVELQLCTPLEHDLLSGRRRFWEPHLHAVVWGATKEQVMAAFKIRRDPTVTVRKRSLKVQPVTDLPRLLRYLTKSKPQGRVQWRDDAKVGEAAKGWSRTRLSPEHAGRWFAVMSQYRPAQLLSGTGNSLRDVGRPRVAELATTKNRIPPRGPQRGR